MSVATDAERMSNPRITPAQRENLIALHMREGNDRPTACIILDAREAAAERNGRNRCLDHRDAIQARIAQEPAFSIGERVLATRYYGETEPTHLATVIDRQSSTHLIIRYAEAGAHEGAFLVVSRRPSALRKVQA